MKNLIRVYKNNLTFSNTERQNILLLVDTDWEEVGEVRQSIYNAYIKWASKQIKVKDSMLLLLESGINFDYQRTFLENYINTYNYILDIIEAEI